MINGDTKGYYKILGVPPSATAAQIKKAYRVKAQELHPDKNLKKDTTRQFQHLQEAFNVLKNPQLRAQYDSLHHHSEFHQHHPQAHQTPKNRAYHSYTYTKNEPIKCSRCSAISAQPRYVIFFEVKSFLMASEKKLVDGVFCSKCASIVSLQASLTTWLLGWWGLFPWGILRSLHALGTNLLGGIRPPHINAIILEHQASYFNHLGKIPLAKAIVSDALREAAKFQSNPTLYYQATPSFYEGQPQKEYQMEFNTFYNDLQKLDNSINLKSYKKLRNQWGIFNRVFLIQLTIIIAFIFFLLDVLK